MNRGAPASTSACTSTDPTLRLAFISLAVGAICSGAKPAESVIETSCPVTRS
jgi:hypothetical protein